MQDGADSTLPRLGLPNLERRFLNIADEIWISRGPFISVDFLLGKHGFLRASEDRGSDGL